MFHFRLKSDKKPDGTKISAVQHIDYIRHEGNYAEEKEWARNNKFVGNFISSADIKDACKGQETLLYKTDDFGSIRNSHNGIEVTEKASPTTIAIALMLAYESMNHKPLIISGSSQFKKSMLDTAIFANLPISFADKLMQTELKRRKEKIENERRNFIAKGGTIKTKSATFQPFTPNVKPRTIADVTRNGLCLPSLSKLNLVHSEPQSTDLFLQSDESRKLEQLAERINNNVRWDFSQQFLNLAKQTSQKILSNIENKLDNVYAESHVEYINRERAFENRGGCIFHSHHLPKWAKNDPKKFFKAADKYEGIGNRRYMEIEFALPNELKTVEQYRQIIDVFIEKHLNDHYYAYAIHDKIGVMSNGQHHPHVHIMFSERLIDDVEKIKERPAKYFFLYPARKKKDGTEPNFEEKYRRGAPKNRHWADKSFLSVIRADFANIKNEVLAKNGYSIRVDHRTLKEQKADAEKKGDTFLAKILNRMPEEYIGIVSCQNSENPKLERLKEMRKLRNQHFDFVLKTDSLTKEIDELETKDAVLAASINAKKFIESDEFTSQNTDEIKELKEKLKKAIEEVNRWKRSIISQHEAEEKAKLEYLTPQEREVWHQYFETLNQKKQLENFLQSLKKPDQQQSDAMQHYDDLVSGVKSQIFALLSSAAILKPSIEEINRKLETPDCKKNILLVTHQILQENTFARKMLKVASEKLDRSIENLKNAIVAHSLSDQNFFKTREVYDIIRRHFFALKKEYEKTLDLKFDLQKRIISNSRAIAMAQNIFVHGDLKKFRASLRQYKKDAENFAKNLESYNQQEKMFKNKKWTAENQSAFLQEKYFLTKEKMSLDLEKTRLDNLKLALDKQKSDFESTFNNPDSIKQIQLIAASILRKNFKFVRKTEEIKTRLKQLFENIEHTKKQVDTLQLQLNFEKRHTCYKILSNSYSKISAVSLIADAILQEPHAAQLVARSSSNNLEMEKDWELMSELDKDELIHKQIFRDL